MAKIKHLQPVEPAWRRKMREAMEKEADNILGMVGIMSAIWAWREVVLMQEETWRLRSHVNLLRRLLSDAVEHLPNPDDTKSAEWQRVAEIRVALEDTAPRRRHEG